MSQRHQVGTVLPGYNPLKVANAPTIGTATAGGSNCASVTFTAPSCVGGAAISSYTAYANCGVRLTSGASSPLVITGLTSGTSYTFKVIATNLYGPSGPSSASSSITARVQGQVLYCTPGTFSWVAPAGVTSISVIAVGGGGGGAGNRGGTMNGGGGGALAYTNNITVVPGNSYALRVGSGFSFYCAGASEAKSSYFVCNPKVSGGGCATLGYGTTAGTVTAGTGYSGGLGGTGGYNGNAYGYGAGGGGAGGYSGAGGKGSKACGTGGYSDGTNGSGGSGGGGAVAANGGGVGVLGEGASGTTKAGAACYPCSNINATSRGIMNGTAGSGGSARLYGGGGGGNGNCGGGGAVRIIWPGTTRSFPSTNTGNL